MATRTSGGDGPKAAKATKSGAGTAKKPVLLSGGNPQIAKGYGDEPVQAYIAAMPGWKSAVGARLDAIIERAVPGVEKAVKWNSPMYGMKGEGWFLGLHCFTRYVKVAFFRGARLDPVPPVGSKQKEVRYLHIHEDDKLDEACSPTGSCRPAACPARRCETGVRKGLSNAGLRNRSRDVKRGGNTLAGIPQRPLSCGAVGSLMRQIAP